jgi:hypothetical protein
MLVTVEIAVSEILVICNHDAVYKRLTKSLYIICRIYIKSRIIFSLTNIVARLIVGFSIPDRNLIH